ncbi:MAG: preprotein translocase subunit SecE [Candidatus Chisholmbacteria bacterium RIFCSPHIGHO2_01_FULL_48_12]|uniref:Protein translocase subunit SecE n=1 Tax=Candidatus Chisholmbacteria bacterium RIFCSPHIGHO2_01_FULL_48_12 TaxID=1797589 RepID=A0A1G1VLP9_9BACT|nr:MAG: preprotein translocase subunit SecE [Candidatus Chisholmbacteria bacterium RIFCSPHIGHO2_01_FULL_48_12]
MKPKAAASSLTLTTPKFGADFFKEAYRELKRVTWPTRQQALHLTLVVITVSVMVGAYVGVLDLGFTKIMAILLK